MLKAVESLRYDGAHGVAILTQLRTAMLKALISEDWLELQRLDRTCSAVVARVLECPERDFEGLQVELTVLKSIYWQALSECKERAGGPDAIELLR